MYISTQFEYKSELYYFYLKLTAAESTRSTW